MPLNVSEGTLIPRPDTGNSRRKALQIALENWKKIHRTLSSRSWYRHGRHCVGVGLSFLPFVKKHIQLDVIGVDLMPEVVKLAQSNAEKNQLKVQFCRVVGLKMLKGSLILSSAIPFIDETDEHLYKVTCVSSLVRHWWRAKTVY